MPTGSFAARSIPNTDITDVDGLEQATGHAKGSRTGSAFVGSGGGRAARNAIAALALVRRTLVRGRIDRIYRGIRYPRNDPVTGFSRATATIPG